MKTIFLSDIHIGIDAVTNLYQSSLDQANLKLVLKYILDNDVDNVVIIGDWLDLWMYGTDIVPPTVQQIFAANPQIFTKQSDGSGDFVSVLDKCTFSYVNGNHDITVTESDLNGYFSTVSEKQINCIDCSKEPNGYELGIIFAEHGHWHSAVCRPYENELLPLGYFITRAAMQAMIVKRAPLPPLDVIGMQRQINYEGITFAQAILILIANQIGFNDLSDLIFTMPDGSQISGDIVADKFQNLSINDLDFLRTDVGGSLDESAQNLSHKHQILLFDHTHIKELQQYNECIYANTGFLAANNPVNGMPISTFVEIEDANGYGPYSISLMKIDATGNLSTDKTLTIEQSPYISGVVRSASQHVGTKNGVSNNVIPFHFSGISGTNK